MTVQQMMLLPRPAARTTSTLGIQKAMLLPQDAVSTGVNGAAEKDFESSRVTIPANTLLVGQVIMVRAHLTFTQSTAGPSQRPRVRFGPPATALASRTLLIDAGDLGLLANVANARAYVEITMTVRAVGTSGLIEAAGKLDFTSMGSGQCTSFLAGPSGSGGESGNPVAVNTTVDNTLTMSTQFSAATAGNNTILRQMRVTTDVTGAG